MDPTIYLGKFVSPIYLSRHLWKHHKLTAWVQVADNGIIFRVWLLVVVCLRLGDGRVQTLNIFNSLSTKYFLAEVIFQVNYKMRNMKYLQWAELFLTTSHLSSSSWSKLVRDNFAEKLWCCCLGSALLEAGLVWGCRGWSLPQHFLQTIRGVRTAACHRLRIQHLLHNLMKMDVLHGRHRGCHV